MIWDSLIDTSEDFAVEASHIICSEWRPERDRLIQNATQRPNIALHVVGLVTPHLWTRIVWRSGLSVKKASLGDFGNIHVTELRLAIFVEEHICTLQISVENVSVMKSLQSFDNENENFPNVVLS